MAERLKAERKLRSFAILRNCPISARKVRLVADLLRGKQVDLAFGILRYSPQGCVSRMEQLLKSAVANWTQKNPELSLDETPLFISKISVDEGMAMKRIRPRAQGRAARILKRSCHIYVEVAAQKSLTAEEVE